MSILCFLAAVVGPVEAQDSDRRRGLWLGLGLGQAWADATCSICFAQETGLAAHARAGGTISPRLLVGVEGTGWLKSGQTDRSFLMAAALGTLYPVPDLGFHLKGGVGQYWYVEEDSAIELSTQGLAVELGAGFDIRITPGLSLAPFATMVRSGFGNPTRRDKASGFKQPLFSDLTLKFYQFGLAVTLH